MSDVKPLTDEQKNALRRYAAAHGRTWKSRLANDWVSGKCQGPLQQIRNIKGPGWLRAVRLSNLEGM